MFNSLCLTIVVLTKTFRVLITNCHTKILNFFKLEPLDKKTKRLTWYLTGRKIINWPTAKKQNNLNLKTR
ncbi:unnamed protein product [Acanthoscelides obtectus]|uniref:Secreted protein n=1 Tax=Acanthoscelides obtectus TaxID=200917 RepID=A0A9P0JIA3_ACAOB|nr:unnamed protein product [Acanthoscelides obtectus]CAK1649986.1 hypothetical protein AOBTE_LOCUS16525 [Acanthoscelides obtectus]